VSDSPRVETPAAYPPLPVSLRGDYASLEPLTHDHAGDLSLACADGELWKLWYTYVPTPKLMTQWIATALAAQSQGKGLPFTVKDGSGKVVGSTRYMNIEADRKRLEIGTTWYAKSVQGGALNTECKLMLLTHAFEVLQCMAVEFRTSYMNQQSRNAIAKLGAKQDGVLRAHGLHTNGTVRDTVVFSILASEWPTIKVHLQFRLARLAGKLN
jgi:N-acetyltransferase